MGTLLDYELDDEYPWGTRNEDDVGCGQGFGLDWAPNDEGL
jgi:hypothetical protein